jgi:hypothetical protein
MSNTLLHSSPSSSSSNSGSGSLLGGKNSSKPQHSPLSPSSSSSSSAYAQGGILAELEADLERLGIDVTKQDHLLIESPPPAGKPITVTENSTSAETGQTSVDTAAAAYMNQQQQQQYMQWLQWQNYYQQQNQCYQMQMMQQQQLQQQQQQQQYPDVIQPIQSHVPPVEATSTQFLPAQSAVEPSAVWTGHASEVDRLRSIFGRKR